MTSTDDVASSAAVLRGFPLKGSCLPSRGKPASRHGGTCEPQQLPRRHALGGRCVDRPHLARRGGFLQPARSPGRPSMARAGGKGLRKFPRKFETTHAVIYSKADPQGRPAAILATPSGAWLLTGKANVTGSASRWEPLFLPLTCQTADQLFKLEQITKLDADVAAALAIGGDGHPGPNGCANPPLKICDVEIFCLRLTRGATGSDGLRGQGFRLTDRHTALQDLFRQRLGVRGVDQHPRVTRG